jgi:undecaprenyl-diphosphatase
MMFTVLLHIGTLVSVFIMYWKDIWELIKELFVTIADLVRGRGLQLQEKPVRKLGIMIIVATIPTALMGFLFNDFFESLNSILWAIGIGWIFTGFLLYFSEKMSTAKRDIRHMNFRNAIFIGIMQGIAICPGVSRSGSTMVGGLITGFTREFTVKFAFLISIPSILGAAVLEIPEAVEAANTDMAVGPMVAGVVAAAVCGVLAIKVMIKVVVAQKLKYFAIYVWILGALTVGYGLYTQFHP